MLSGDDNLLDGQGPPLALLLELAKSTFVSCFHNASRIPASRTARNSYDCPRIRLSIGDIITKSLGLRDGLSLKIKDTEHPRELLMMKYSSDWKWTKMD